MPLFDHHTHNAAAPAGQAVVSLPREVVAQPEAFSPQPGALYSAGVHPWWTAEGDAERLWQGVLTLAAHPQVVAIGETGFDRLRGDFALQPALFARHARLAAERGKPLIIHCVRAWAELLAARRAQ
ncbi:MAG: TatD family hydrolase, partial [Bacteroidaceae bacterium]|nr:TatD family hydrolase [Bacteroidaceae bacterium]